MELNQCDAASASRRLVSVLFVLSLTGLMNITEADNKFWDSVAGGDFLDDGNWSPDAPGLGDSAFFNNNLNDTVSFSGSVNTQDLFLQNTSGTITFDVGASNDYTMSRFTIVGGSAGQTNDVIFSSGNMESGLLLIGNASGAVNNSLVVTGSNTAWTGTGGVGTTAAIRVGSNGGSGSSLTIADGAFMESETQVIIGLQGASDNLLTVTGEGSQLSNAQSISLGDNTSSPQTNNQMKVLDGGFVTTRELIIGTTAMSPDNTVTVSGPGSRLNVRGGQQFPPTEGGQKHDVGRASNNNKLLIENGGEVDGNAIFLLGREPTSTNNLLSVVDGSLAGWGIEIRQGKVLIENSAVEISREFDNLALQFLGGSLLAEMPSAEIDFRSGSLATVHANIDNGSAFTVGDGGATPATYRMKLNKEGNVNGTHSFADGLLLNANGRLEGSGDIEGSVSGNAGAQVSVGSSVGLITATGDWDNSGMTVMLELDDLSTTTIPGRDFDWLGVGGAFTHGGQITIELGSLVHPDQPKTLQLISWGSDVGSSINTSVSFIGDQPLDFSFLPNGLFVDVPTAPVVLLGDANKDGQVTGADLISVQQNFGNVGAVPLQGDANNDGQVTGADLISVQQNFGNVLNPASAVAPEPATLALLILACGCTFRRSLRSRAANELHQTCSF